jgi:hypothetical protein
MVLGQKGETGGRVFNMGAVAPGTRIYFKPSMPKMIYRKAGVIRKSDKVIARNEKVAKNPPASKCKGKPWKEFVKCLSAEMKKV